MSMQVFVTFAALCVLLELTPGPDTFLVLRYSVGRTRTGMAAAAGSAMGCLVWGAAVALGLAALLERSAVAYRIVTVAGGLYLLYLGISGFLRSRRAASADVEPVAAGPLAGLDATAPDAAAKLNGYADLYAAVLERQRMCLCGMLAAEYQTLPTGMRRRVTDFFALNTAWLRRVLEQGRADGSLTLPGTVEDVAAMVLGGLEGALLICRMDGDVARFRAAAAGLLAGLTTAADAP